MNLSGFFPFEDEFVVLFCSLKINICQCFGNLEMNMSIFLDIWRRIYLFFWKFEDEYFEFFGNFEMSMSIPFCNLEKNLKPASGKEEATEK